MAAKQPARPATREPIAARARATKPSPGAQRPSGTKLWLRRQRHLLRPLLLGLSGLAACALIIGAVLAADPAARLRGLASAISGTGIGFSVQEVRVEGREYTPRDIFEAALGVKRGDATLGFSPAEARARLEASAWIETAHVERRLPGTIIVRIKERRAFAIWQREGQFSIIDREGRVMQSNNVGAFGPLPLVVGLGANAGAAGIIDLLRAQPSIAGRVEAAVRVSERRWNLRLTGGADILLPEGHEGAAITRLVELHARDRLLDRPLATVDMRLPDRLVVRMNPAPTATPPPINPTQVRSNRG
jgi:cell division protein FtsQ